MTLMRRTLLRGLTAVPMVVGASTLPSAAQAPVPAAPPEGAGTPSTMPPPGRTLDLYAVELPKDGTQVRLGYGFTPETATYPGPLIEMTEGETIAIRLHNQVPEATLKALQVDPETPIGVSLHVHGVRYQWESDGTAHTGSHVPPGEPRTYVWHAKAPSHKDRLPGTAGYWWYHDHVVGTPHGTGGLTAGLLGPVVVRRSGDPRPDHTFTTFFGNLQTINLRRSPNIDAYDPMNPVAGPNSFVAREGERVEFIVICTGNDMHTWHLHGHSWADTRTGLIENGQSFDSVRTIDNKTIGPGDSFGFQVIAGDISGPGDWMLHCHMQFHSDMGMATAFHVLDINGNPVSHDMPAMTSMPSMSSMPGMHGH
jgi:FtsP/CotA-like multicopper oxidase with cupredoxin domain